MSFGLESPIHAPKFLVFGDFTSKFRGTPKRHFLARNDAFEPSLIQIWRTVRPVAWQRKQKNERKKKIQWQTGYSPRPPTSPYRSRSLHAGWPPMYSSIDQVLLKSVQCRCGWSKIALSQYFGHWLIQQLVLPYKPCYKWHCISNWQRWSSPVCHCCRTRIAT